MNTCFSTGRSFQTANFTYFENSSGFHTQKQLQDLDQQRTGHGVAVTGRLWENVPSLEGWCWHHAGRCRWFSACYFGCMSWVWGIYWIYWGGCVVECRFLRTSFGWRSSPLAASSSLTGAFTTSWRAHLRLYVSSDSLRSWWDPTTTTFGYLMKHLSKNDCERKIEPRSPLNSVKWCTVMRHDASHVA